MEKGKLVLEDRLYTNTHEWVKKVGEKKYQIGITDYAQYLLKDIIAIDLPRIGVELKQFQEWGGVDSNKTTATLYSPLEGKVVATNENNLGELNNDGRDEPSTITWRYGGEFYNINKKPYETWLVEMEISDDKQLERLLSPEGYKKFIEGL